VNIEYLTNLRTNECIIFQKIDTIFSSSLRCFVILSKNNEAHHDSNARNDVKSSIIEDIIKLFMLYIDRIDWVNELILFVSFEYDESITLSFICLFEFLHFLSHEFNSSAWHHWITFFFFLIMSYISSIRKNHWQYRRWEMISTLTIYVHARRSIYTHFDA
jgi:hypothetical protein